MFPLPFQRLATTLPLLFVALGCAPDKEELSSEVTKLRPPLGAPVVDLAISLDGLKLAAVTNPVADSSSPSGSLALWDLRSQRLLGSRQFPVGVARVLFLSGNALLIGLIDGSLQRLDANSLKTTSQLASPHGAVTSLAISMNSQEVFAGHLSGVIQRAQANDLTLLSELPAASRSPVVAILPRGKPDAFYFVCWNGFWGAHGRPAEAEQEGNVSGQLELVIHDAVVVEPDKVLATAGPGSVVTWVDLSAGRTDPRLRSAREIVGIAKGKPGELWTIDRGPAVQRWQLKERQIISEWELKGSLHSLAISLEGQYWCVGDDRGNVYLGPLEPSSK